METKKANWFVRSVKAVWSGKYGIWTGVKAAGGWIKKQYNKTWVKHTTLSVSGVALGAAAIIIKGVIFTPWAVVAALPYAVHYTAVGCHKFINSEFYKNEKAKWAAKHEKATEVKEAFTPPAPVATPAN